MGESFTDRLKKYDSAWKQATEDQEKTGFEKPSEGDKIAVLRSATIGESKGTSKRLQVTWDFRILKPEADMNKSAMAWDSIEDDRGMSAIRGRLAAMGVKPPKSLVDLGPALDKACDTKVKLNVSYRKAGSDYYDLKVLAKIVPKVVAAPEPEEDDTVEAEEEEV